MRRVLSCLAAATAALLFVTDADAAPRGHGWAGSGKHRIHRPVQRFAPPARFDRRHVGPRHLRTHPNIGHHGFGRHRFGHKGAIGPGAYLVGDRWGWGGPVQNVVFDQQIGQSVTTFPVATGIPAQPAAEPVVYVLDAPGRVRKGYDRFPAETGSLDPGAGAGGPRVVHVRVPRG
jgi:hypothetical protein